MKTDSANVLEAGKRDVEDDAKDDGGENGAEEVEDGGSEPGGDEGGKRFGTGASAVYLFLLKQQY